MRRRAILRCLTRIGGAAVSAVAVAIALSILCPLSEAVAEELQSFTNGAPDSSETPDLSAECDPDTPASLAIRGCSKLLGSEDTDPKLRVRVYTMRGHAWLVEEEPIAAISDFSRAIELDATNISALKGRARSHEYMKNYDEAIKDWTAIVALRPNDPEIYRERGYTKQIAGQHELAIKDFTRVLELDPNNIDSLIGRAMSYDLLDRLDDALKDFEAAIQINAKYAPVYTARGEVWQRRGVSDKAIADYYRSLEINGINLKVRQALRKLGVFWINP